MGQKNKPIEYTWGEYPGKYINNFNLLGGSTARVPEWWMNLFPMKDERLGADLFRAGYLAVIAAAITGGYRGIQHMRDIQSLAEKDNPAKKLESQLSTTYEGNMTPEKNIEKTALRDPSLPPDTLELSPILSWHNAGKYILPASAVILAATGAYKGADAIADKERNRLLDESLARKENVKRKLMLERAKVAKGTTTPSSVSKTLGEIRKDDMYIKTASQIKQAEDGKEGNGKENPVMRVLRGGVSTLGLTAALTTAAAAIGSYKYFSEDDEDNLKYKAYEKALKEYARVRADQTPITIINQDAKKYFDKIDQGAVKPDEKQQLRSAPSYENTAINQPISVTL